MMSNFIGQMVEPTKGVTGWLVGNELQQKNISQKFLRSVKSLLPSSSFPYLHLLLLLISFTYYILGWLATHVVRPTARIRSIKSGDI